MKPALLFLLSCCLLPAGELRVLIVTGRNNHDWRATTPYLQKLLEQSGRMKVSVTEDAPHLTRQMLRGYDALVLNYCGPRWGEQAEKAVESFVREGGGLAAVHAASYPFGAMEVLGEKMTRTGTFEPPWPAYGDMIGAVWSADPPKSGHGKRHTFVVKWTDRGHPIAQGLAPEFSINDELYHSLRVRPGIHVLATAFDDPVQNGTGKQEPLLWTVHHGKGRIFHTALGHDVAAMEAPGFGASLTRGVEWVATRTIRVTVVTGGHEHEASFYSLFEGQKDLVVNVNPHPVAFRADLRRQADVLVLYDLVQDLEEKQKENLKNFAEGGKGIVILHHAIADYNTWEWWWREVMGGRYLLQPDGGQPASTYQHDVELQVMPVGDHPVTRGVGPMTIVDETYKKMWISPKAKVLLKTDHPLSDGPLAWISPFERSRVVYVQLGHGRTAHEHPGYRRLVRNAMQWAGGTDFSGN